MEDATRTSTIVLWAVAAAVLGISWAMIVLERLDDPTTFLKKTNAGCCGAYALSWTNTSVQSLRLGSYTDTGIISNGRPVFQNENDQ